MVINFCQADLTKKIINLHYARGITPKRVTSGGGHFCGLAPGQHSFKETSQRWRDCVRFHQPGNRTPTPRAAKNHVTITILLTLCKALYITISFELISRNGRRRLTPHVPNLGPSEKPVSCHKCAPLPSATFDKIFTASRVLFSARNTWSKFKIFAL